MAKMTRRTVITASAAMAGVALNPVSLLAGGEGAAGEAARGNTTRTESQSRGEPRAQGSAAQGGRRGRRRRCAGGSLSNALDIDSRSVKEACLS